MAIYGHHSDYTKTTVPLFDQIDGGSLRGRFRFLSARVRHWTNRLRRTRDPHVSVGRHTYGIVPGRTVIGATADCPVTVGAFCSIAAGVTIIAKGNHVTDLPSTFPFETLIFSGMRGLENYDAVGAPVVIGHDVWIGQNAVVLPGVIIGTGAVIGAGAVVTRDVAPFEIVVGNPARSLRRRFNQDRVDQLLASEWWTLSDTQLRAIGNELYSRDIGAFAAAVSAQRRRV